MFRDARTPARTDEQDKNSMPAATLRWAEAKKINYFLYCFPSAAPRIYYYRHGAKYTP